VNHFAEQAGLVHLVDQHDRDRRVAMWENEQMNIGRTDIQPQPYEHADTHLDEHFKEIKSAAFDEKDPVVKELFITHANATVEMKRQAEIPPTEQLKAEIAQSGGGGGFSGIGAAPSKEEVQGGGF
jgi:hypothetical protein